MQHLPREGQIQRRPSGPDVSAAGFSPSSRTSPPAAASSKKDSPVRHRPDLGLPPHHPACVPKIISTPFPSSLEDRLCACLRPSSRTNTPVAASGPKDSSGQGRFRRGSSCTWACR